jgi:hypothetical protein
MVILRWLLRPQRQDREGQVSYPGRRRAQGGVLLHQDQPSQRLPPGVDAPRGHRQNDVLDAPWPLRILGHGMQTHQHSLHLLGADEGSATRLPPPVCACDFL